MEEVSIDHIWELHESADSLFYRLKLFEFYAPWSRRMAAILYKRYHHHLLQYEDYISIVSEALVESIDNYKRERNVPFEAYCFTRMKGYVLNEINRLRKSDCVQRTQYVVKQPTTGLTSDYDYPMESLEDVVGFTIHAALEMLLASDHREDEPHNQYSKNQLVERIRAIVERLSDKERVVINTYYYQFMNYDQIASLLNVSRARISQIHKSAVSSIREIYEKSY